MPISFSVKVNKLVPYVDLNFDDIKNDFIEKIIMGPKCDVSVLDIQMLLMSKGYKYDKIQIIHRVHIDKCFLQIFAIDNIRSLYNTILSVDF